MAYRKNSEISKREILQSNLHLFRAQIISFKKGEFSVTGYQGGENMSSLLGKTKIVIISLFVRFLHFTYLKIRKKSSFLFFPIITLLLILNKQSYAAMLTSNDDLF
jgi:hypothetical protein